jgi:hypothetical protein
LVVELLLDDDELSEEDELELSDFEESELPLSEFESDEDEDCWRLRFAVP